MRPAGWPADLPDPDAPEFAERAVTWLLEIGPPEWRSAPAMRDHPVILAFRARYDVASRLDGARAAYAAARAELVDQADPPEVASFLEALEAEGAHLVALQREVVLVEEALRGRRWRPRL